MDAQASPLCRLGTMRRRTFKGGGPQGSGPFRKRKAKSGLTLFVHVLTYEKIEFCRHSLDRMKMRGVTRDEVIEAINDPTSTGHKTRPGRSRIRKAFASSGKMIDVVYDEIEDRVRVITTFVR